MSDITAISWTDSTFNPWTGCTKVSPGCDGCYAEAWSKRAGDKVGKWGPSMPRVRTTPANWRKPLAWNGQEFTECASCGWRGEAGKARKQEIGFIRSWCPSCNGEAFLSARRRVFCTSLADVFDNEVPTKWRRDLFDLIELTPNLDWLLLTKRIGNVQDMVRIAKSGDWLAGRDNVWLGATIVNQPEAGRDIPKLLAVPARVRFLSMEPLLGAVKLPLYIDARRSGAFDVWTPGVDWVIVGGESGHGARPMHPDWARSLRDQCAAAGVPFHFKQWGEWLPWTQFMDAGIEDPPEQTRFATAEWQDGEWRDVGRPLWCDSQDGVIDDEQCVGRVGKKAAGHLLDGVAHQAFPEVRT